MKMKMKMKLKMTMNENDRRSRDDDLRDLLRLVKEIEYYLTLAKSLYHKVGSRFSYYFSYLGSFD